MPLSNTLGVGRTIDLLVMPRDGIKEAEFLDMGKTLTNGEDHLRCRWEQHSTLLMR